LDLCLGEAVVVIDSDLQDPPEVISDLYAHLQTGYDVVYAKRRVRSGESWFKKTTARMFYRILASITSVDIPLDTGDFRIMRRNIVDVLKRMPEQNKYLRGQIAWAGFRQTFVEYDRHARNAGETGYPLSKMLRFAFDGITAFSDVPLRMVTWAGFGVSGIAFIIMCYALISRFWIKDYAPGWTSMLLSVMFIGGIQLVGIGIIGEYISRMNKNIQNRPLYIIRDTNVPVVQ
jgi:dolichol-phosphate mannosyltransferase